MNKMLLLLLLVLGIGKTNAQYSSLSVSFDKTRFCDVSSSILVSGTIRANAGVYTGYHFVGLRFRFYTDASATTEIGNYMIYKPAGFPITNTNTFNPTYFEGPLLYGATVTAETYSTSAPSNGGIFSASFYLPYTAFPTKTGVQFYVAVEGIDQSNNTTAISAPKGFDYPIAYDKPIISSVATHASKTTICSGDQVTITTSPDYSYDFNYQWYKDGNVLPGETAPFLLTNTTGVYAAQIADGCQSIFSGSVTISQGALPAAPIISSSAGNILCNGAATTLHADIISPGIVRWSNGASGNDIAVGNSGYYTCVLENACGTSPASNAIPVTAANTPGQISLNRTGSVLLCNGESLTVTANLSTSGNYVLWSSGLVGTSMTTFGTGNYYATEYNSYCGAGPASSSVVVTALNTPSVPSINPATPQTLCNGNSIQLNAVGTDNMQFFQNGTPLPAGSTITTNVAGSYTLRASNACGTSQSSAALVITTNNTPPPPALSFSGAVTLCDGAFQPVSVSPSTSGGVIHWSNGTTGNSIQLNSAGNYYAYESNPGCGNGPNSASINITTLNTPLAPVVTPSANQLLCNGASINLSSSGSNIIWSNGSIGNTLATTAAGTYYTFDRNYCGNSPNSNPVVITTAICPQPSPGTSFQVCPGTLKTLDAGAGYDSYQWSNGATTRTTAVGPGIYSVTVTKNGCSAVSQNVTVSYYTLTPPVITSSGPLTICAGNNVTLIASPAVAYAWSNGATTTNISVSTAGSYFVTATDNNGCVSTSNPVTVTVNPLPLAAISGSTTICRGSILPMLTFVANAGVPPYTFTYQLNGSAFQTISSLTTNAVSLAVPTNQDGTFTYSLVSIKESSSTTCSNTASGSATIVVNPLPEATISGTNSYCQNSPSPLITLSASGGTAPYTFTYSINNGAAQTVQSVLNTATVAVPTNLSGVFTYKLISVQESSSTKCSNNAQGAATVTINPLPSAAINGSTIICQQSASPFISFFGSGGNAPYTFQYSRNGGILQSDSTGSGDSASIAVPTDSAGAYEYRLLSVKESSSTACVNAATGSALVIVNPLPEASISGSKVVCQNSTRPFVTLTATGGTAPYTFTYSINNGTPISIHTITGNSVAIEVPTSFSGTFSYSLISVQDNSITRCINNASGTATITVNPLPSAKIIGSGFICQASIPSGITITGSRATAPYQFNYQVNGGSVQSINSDGSAVTIPVPTGMAGTYTYSLISVSESSETACTNTAIGSATVVVNPLPLASISGDTIVCASASSPLIRFSGSNATAPYTFDYTINGGVVRQITSPGKEITLPVPTAVAGVYTYSLIGVRESSNTACSNTVAAVSLITVNPLPQASIRGSKTVCQGASAPVIVLSATGATAPYTFSYRINGGTPQFISSGPGDSITISAPTNVAGKYVYELLSVQESSTTTCSNAANGNATIIVNPLPARAALVTASPHLCNGISGTITIYNYTQGYSYTWFKDGLKFKQSSLDTIINPLSGKFNVLVSSDKGCDASAVSDTLQITTGTISQPVITGYSRVCPGGKTTITVVPKDSAREYESYRWTDLSSGTITSKLKSFSFSAGEYQIKVFRQGCNDSTILSVTNNDTIFPAGRIYTDTNRIAYGGQVMLTAEVTDAVEYHWQFGDGRASVTKTNVVRQQYFTSGDSLRITAIATSPRNCSTAFSTFLAVKPFDPVTIPNLSKTGKLKDWNLYPIPFRDQLKVSLRLLKDEPVRVDVFTLSGQWVSSYSFAGKSGDNLFSFGELGSLPPNVTYLFVSYYNNTKHYSKAFKY